MDLVFFVHPPFLEHKSMPRFADMLSAGMRALGHNVQIWYPRSRFFQIFPVFKKWLGYVDQYILFPAEVRRRLKTCSQHTLFVFTDHALGPWLSLIGSRPHVVHCHDFLAQLSAQGEIPENRLSWTGKRYQGMIRHGFNKGKYFISVSQNTQKHLHHFLNTNPEISEVVYNGLSKSFYPYSVSQARDLFTKKRNIPLRKGYLLHVGGNQWYKNRIGLVHVYNAWRSKYQNNLPLLLIGESADENLLKAIDSSPFKSEIHLLDDVTDEELNLAYSGASVCVFPSLAEGFGWPIAEAMASGCPLITTDEMPMTEVAGDAGFLIPKCPQDKLGVLTWAFEVAKVLNRVISLSPEQRVICSQKGIANSKRFDSEIAIKKIETIYLTILKKRGFYKEKKMAKVATTIGINRFSPSVK